MSKKHEAISELLDLIGAAWAVRSDKYIDPNDPLENQQKGRKTYHIFPVRTAPYQSSIKRFDTLQSISDWIDDVLHGRNDEY